MAESRNDVESLQFETAVPDVASPPTAATPRGVTCAACQRQLENQYFDVNGQSVCESCRDQIVQQSTVPRGWRLPVKAGLFGLGAAIVGAILYYAVVAITNFEIGIVAIAIGYIVGYAVRRGAGGRGGRRFQVLALALTYWSVGLAYIPVAFSDLAEENKQAAQTTPAAPVAERAEPESGSEQVNLSVVIPILLGLSLALPVLVVLGSMPGGLISAAIIAFGMQQAWRMTAAPQFHITGPYRIGTAPSAPA